MALAAGLLRSALLLVLVPASCAHMNPFQRKSTTAWEARPVPTPPSGEAQPDAEDIAEARRIAALTSNAQVKALLVGWADSYSNTVASSAWTSDEHNGYDNGRAVDTPPTKPHIVDIKRITYPVKRAGKVVSFKSSYMGNIRMGVDQLKVIFDTGSGHVVVPSVGCTSETCMTHQRYNASTSPMMGFNADMKGQAITNVSAPASRITIGYGTGQVTGELFIDEMCILGQSQFCVETRAVQAVEMSPVPFQELQVDGIVGLGLPPLTVHKSFSFFESLIANNLVSVPHFGFFLTDGDNGELSELALGGHNPSRLLRPDEPLNWAPVVKPAQMGHWMVQVSGVYVGGQKIDMCGDDSECRGIVDSGSSHLGIPGSHFDEIDNLLTASAGDLLDCRLVRSPEVRIEIANAFNLTLTSKNYMRQLPIREDVEVGTNSALSQENAGENETVRPGTQMQEEEEGVVANTTVVSRRCSPRIMPVRVGPPMGPNLFMLGEPLLKQYYTVFDWSGPSVGFGLSISSVVEPEQGPSGLGKLPDNMDVYLMQQRLSTKVVSEDEVEEVYMLQVVVAVTVRRPTLRLKA